MSYVIVIVIAELLGLALDIYIGKKVWTWLRGK